jgi:hypothetical protein
MIQRQNIRSEASQTSEVTRVPQTTVFRLGVLRSTKLPMLPFPPNPKINPSQVPTNG